MASFFYFRKIYNYYNERNRQLSGYERSDFDLNGRGFDSHSVSFAFYIFTRKGGYL